MKAPHFLGKQKKKEGVANQIEAASKPNSNEKRGRTGGDSRDDTYMQRYVSEKKQRKKRQLTKTLRSGSGEAVFVDVILVASQI
jgi:hypothetical protein